MRRSSLLTTFLLAVPLLGQPRVLKPEDFAAIRDVASPQLSPDGKSVAYTVRHTDLAKDKTFTHLWLAAWDGSNNRALTFGQADHTHPRWSPDGRWLAFLSPRADEHKDAQLWLLPVAGGEAEKVTSVKGGVDDFAWAPDSARLVLVVTDPDPRADDPKEDKTPPPLVIDRFMFKRDKVGYLTQRRAHLQLLTLAARTTEPLTSGAHDDLFPVWSPDGREIAFFSKRAADPDRSDDWSIVAVTAQPGGAERTITAVPEQNDFVDADDPLAWSPDGQSLAFIQGGDPKLISYAARPLGVVSSAGGNPRLLTAALDRNISRPHWSADGKSIFAVMEDDGSETLVRFSLAGGAPETVVGGRRKVNDFSVGTGGRIAVLTTTPDRPPELFAADGGALRPLSKQNDPLFADLRLAAVDQAKWRSPDGTEVHGFVMHPVDLPAGGAKPAALLRPHGGPQSQYAAAFNFEAQLFAANGYLVILPNPRGSTGRGTDYAKGIYAAWGYNDIADDLAAVDDAVARGLADPARLGVGGWSYGGMATNYTIATTRRFKAATSGASIGNILAGYGTDQYVRDYENELGTPWKNPDVWLKISFPFLHADRITTPTLFLCGEKDFNVPLLNSEQMYQALSSLGVPTQLIIYPGQFHGLTKPSYILDRYQRYLAWYAKYLAPAATPMAAN